MTQKEKITFMRIALSILHIHMKEEDVDKVVTLYEELLAKKGGMTIKNIVEIEEGVAERNRQYYKNH